MSSLTKLRLIIATLFVSLFLGGFSAGPVFAQSFHYPISQLGNCRDSRECFYYCSIPQNSPACWSYNKYFLNKNVLGDTTQSPQSPDDTTKHRGITFPVAELDNCASPQECMQYCNQPEHQQVCYAFGRKKGLAKNTTSMKHEQVNKEKMLRDAKEKLGCDNMTACQAFCNNPDNRQKCESFARSEGMMGRQEQQQSGQQNYQQYQQGSGHSFTPPTGIPCSSPESCSQWCQSNPDKCQTIKQQSGSAPGSFTSPGGCANEKECMQFCQNHPEQCPGFPKTSTGTSTPPPNWTHPPTVPTPPTPPTTFNPQQYQQYQNQIQPTTGSTGNYPQQSYQPQSYPNYPTH